MTKSPKLDELSVSEFSTELSSSSPAPGGGSTAALAGAMACGLISMVASISIKKLEEKPENNEIIERFKDLVNNSNNTRAGFLELITDDTNAFNDIMACFKMPKNTDNEKQERKASIQSATKNAAEVPLKTADLALQALAWSRELIKIGTSNAITDTGVAGAMAYSAVMGAIWNVKINLGSIKDENYVKEMKMKIQDIMINAKTYWYEIKLEIEEKI
jgi:formiminotetrahydrofolate cyclodeaminase